MRCARLVCLLLLGSALLRCGHDKEGPTPEPAPPPAVDPPAVCTSQLTTTVSITGDGLSPLPIKVMEDTPQLALPRVALVQTQDLDSAATTAAPVSIPDDPAAADQSRVRWVSQQKMVFDVYPELKLSPGLYTVRVDNANGSRGEWTDALLAVPAPAATAITPDILCAAKTSSFTISGSTFIKAAGQLPAVTATSAGGKPIDLTPTRADKCVKLPGSSGLESCGELTVDLSAGTLPSGESFTTYEITVTNPAPVGCGTLEKVTLTMVPAPTLDEINPELICSAQMDNTVKLTGKGFLTIDGTTPTLTLDGKSYSTTASGCTAVTGPKAAVQTCTGLELVIAKGDLSAGIFKAAVQNPAPADCVSSNDVSFAVVDPPSVSAVKPDLVCAEQADQTIQIEGTSFVAITDASGVVTYPEVTIGTQSFTPTAASGCTTLAGLTSKVETCTSLTVIVAMGALAAGSYPVTVNNPSPAGCTSEEQVSLTLVPAPTVTDISPDLVCPGKQVTITGTGFLTVDGATSVVTLGSDTLSATASDCSALSGPTEAVESCATLTVTIPAGAQGGLQKLKVQNPTPAGCSSTEVEIYVATPPVLTGLAPPDICTALTSTALTLTGSGLLVVNGQAPTLTVGGSSFTATASNCAAVSGLKQPLQVCTTLSFTIAQGALSAGQHSVSVTNPAPADCGSSSLTLEVVPPPTIASVTPTKICVGGGTLAIVGTGFRTGATVTLNGLPADSVVVTSTTISAVFNSASLSVGGPYTVEVKNPDGCSAQKSAAVTVVPGPQLFFVDPPVVYNGINTQVTLHGSGFTGGVQSVGIRPAGSSTTPVALTFTTDAAKPNQVQATVPKATAAGTYDIVLEDQTTCDAVLQGGLKVVSQVTLQLLAINPPFGWTQSATAVTITADSSVGGGLQPVPRLYLNPTTGTQAAALVSVAFLDAGRVTAIAPKGLAVGTYDLIAVNPDGGVGLLAAAFKVNQLAPPVLLAITPGSIANITGQSVKVSGQDFRTPTAVLRCLDLGSNLETNVTPVVNGFSSTLVDLVVDGSMFPNGAICVVRITNGDDQSYGDLSSLVITNSAQNLTWFKSGPAMNAARRALVAASNRATLAARFLYAIGGDSGSTSTTLASVEVAPVDIFGQASNYFTQSYPLVTARSYAGVATVGRCIYVAGGINGASPLASVERACVLDPSDRPEIVDLDLKVSSTGGLGDGLWYYQVSAVMPTSHWSNPGGETLPSEPFPLLLPKLTSKQIEVTLHWSIVTGATGYRIYRSPTAGAAADALQLIASVSGNATTSYSDTGVAAQSAQPLRLGATGKWHTLAASLTTPRQGPGVAIAPDPGDTTGTKFNLYVMGGLSQSAALTDHEWLSITIGSDGSQAVGTFVSGGTVQMAQARWQMALFSVGNAEASYVPTPDHYLYAGGGVAQNGSTMVGTVEAFKVQAGGALAAPVTVDAMQPSRAGYGHAAASNFLFVFGGNKAKPDNTATSIKICSGPGSQCSGGPPDLENWNNASGHMVLMRYLLATTIESGFIHILGGQTSTEAATITTEYTIW